MINAVPSAKYELIHEMTSLDNNRLNIVWLCEIAGVSRSGYYDWLKAKPERERREARDRADFELIINAYNFRGYRKGGRSIHMRLLHLKPPVVMNTKKIFRLMRKYGLKCPIRQANPYRKMCAAIDESFIAKNLLQREFKQHGVRSILLTDITYMKRGDGRFSYLSAIKDAKTTEILAHVVSGSLEEDFVLETVNILLRDHGSELKTDALLHSDQGAHYKAIAFIRLLKDASLRQSMSRRANCWDNAPQESLWGHMKDEIDLSECDSNEGTARIVADWIDYYNNDRYQWELAKLSPREYYEYVTKGVYPLPGKPGKSWEI